MESHFTGAKGTLFADRVGFEVYPEPRGESGPGAAEPAGHGGGLSHRTVEVAGEDSTGLHLENFIECVRTRQKPAADVEIGHRSTIVPHLGNIAFRTGRKIRWDAEREEIMDDPKASESPIVRRESPGTSTRQRDGAESQAVWRRSGLALGQPAGSAARRSRKEIVALTLRSACADLKVSATSATSCRPDSGMLLPPVQTGLKLVNQHLPDSQPAAGGQGRR